MKVYLTISESEYSEYSVVRMTLHKMDCAPDEYSVSEDKITWPFRVVWRYDNKYDSWAYSCRGKDCENRNDHEFTAGNNVIGKDCENGSDEAAIRWLLDGY